jgi:mannose-6-phosphate isomerase-like protein (cupin superfamily)
MPKLLPLFLAVAAAFGAEPAAPSAYVTSAEVQAAVKAMDPARPSVNVLLKTVEEGNYKISLVVVRRTPEPGVEDIGQSHELITELYQILSGSGEMETGGTEIDTESVDLKPAVGPTLRGKIVGGKVQKIGPGDTVMILPHVPHRFSHLDGTIVYLATRIEAIHR